MSFNCFQGGFWAPGASDISSVSERLQEYEVEVKLSEKVRASVCLVEGVSQG